MTTITTGLSIDVPATRIGFALRFSQILRAFAGTLADFNRYMDAAHQVHGANRLR